MVRTPWFEHGFTRGFRSKAEVDAWLESLGDRLEWRVGYVFRFRNDDKEMKIIGRHFDPPGWPRPWIKERNKRNRMMASDLVVKIQRLIAEHGDRPVMVMIPDDEARPAADPRFDMEDQGDDCFLI